MRVVAVYGLKTRDYDWLAGFYPARRIAEACENRGVELRFLFPGDVRAFLDNPAETRLGDTVFLTRGDIPRRTVEALEATGRPCANGARARDIANDKLETYRFLSARGFPTPRAVSLGEALPVPGLAFDGAPGSAPIPFPLVVKPRFGSRGAGVALCEGRADVERAVGEANPGDWIAQEYVAHSRGRDIRMLFAGGEILAVACREAAPGEFRSNAAAGGTFRLLDADGGISENSPDEESSPLPNLGRYRDMTLEIAQAAGLWYGSIDWLYVPTGALTVCEINASPGFEALERDCGLDIAGGIVDRLMRLRR